MGCVSLRSKIARSRPFFQPSLSRVLGSRGLGLEGSRDLAMGGGV